MNHKLYRYIVTPEIMMALSVLRLMGLMRLKIVPHTLAVFSKNKFLKKTVLRYTVVYTEYFEVKGAYFSITKSLLRFILCEMLILGYSVIRSF